MEKVVGILAAGQNAAEMPSEDGRGRHGYSSSPRLQLAELVKKFILGAGLMMLPAALLLTLDTGLSVPAILAACTIPGAVFAVIWSFWHCHIRIEVSADGVHFYRGKRLYRSFRLDADFEPTVVKKKLNGIFYGTDREFRLPYKKNRFQTISCHCITGKDFSSLVEDINTLRNGGRLLADPAASASPPAAFRPEKPDCRDFDFHLPRQRMTARERKRLLPLVLVQTGILAVFALAGIAGAFRDPPTQLRKLAFMAFIWLLIAALLYTVTLGRYVSFVKKLPARITLTDSGVRIDERLFLTSQLREIAMTPPGYGETKNGYSFRRRLILSADTGKKEYHLGCTRIAPKELVYEEYEKLLSVLRDWCSSHSVAFREESE